MVVGSYERLRAAEGITVIPVAQPLPFEARGTLESNIAIK